MKSKSHSIVVRKSNFPEDAFEDDNEESEEAAENLNLKDSSSKNVANHGSSKDDGG